jgi:hypothetical protein
MSWEHESPSSPHHSWQHALQTEGRLTKLEVQTESNEGKIESHEKRHDEQVTWNKGFAIALAGLGAGFAHSKAGDLLELIITLLQRFRP